MNEYFDYNATSPLAPAVRARLRSGEIDFFNPSAQHRPARHARKLISGIHSFLLESFKLTKSHEVFFHSGATEGINSLFFSFKHHYPEGKTLIFPSDHPCVKQAALRYFGKKSQLLWGKLQATGEPDFADIKKQLHKSSHLPVLLNWTWVNNETGVTWPLQWMSSLKQKFAHLQIHLDGAQAIGKIQNWTDGLEAVDYATFSGHKFGALKGVGFSFFLRQQNIEALLVGGSQQQGVRSGTLNTLGIVSLQDALEDHLNFRIHSDTVFGCKEQIVSDLEKKNHPFLFVAARESQYRSNNTILLVFKSLTSDRVLPFFDQAGLAVGQGAACSSGGKKPSETLKAMGLGQYAANGVRISFDPFLLPDKYLDYQNKIETVIRRICSQHK